MVDVTVKVRVDFRKEAMKRVAKEANFTSLGRAGAYIRTVMRRSIRRRKPGGKPGEPGKPPKSTGPLRDAILFEVSPQRDDVAIGPTFGGFGKLGKLQEEGGTVRRRNKKTGKVVLVNYPARPFAAPALEAAMPKISSFWKSSVSS